jgi:hypothetical protein
MLSTAAPDFRSGLGLFDVVWQMLLMLASSCLGGGIAADWPGALAEGSQDCSTRPSAVSGWGRVVPVGSASAVLDRCRWRINRDTLKGGRRGLDDHVWYIFWYEIRLSRP